jgi:hypothetical protein
LPEIRWVNTDCSDIAKDKFVGGIETIEQKTPGSSDWMAKTINLEVDNSSKTKKSSRTSK